MRGHRASRPVRPYARPARLGAAPHRGGTPRHSLAYPAVRAARRAAAVRLGRPVRLTLLSRASDLARIQAIHVGRAIEAGIGGASVTYATRVASGDRDATTPLAALATKGVFTADLSGDLASGAADL